MEVRLTKVEMPRKKPKSGRPQLTFVYVLEGEGGISGTVRYHRPLLGVASLSFTVLKKRTYTLLNPGEKRGMTRRFKTHTVEVLSGVVVASTYPCGNMSSGITGPIPVEKLQVPKEGSKGKKGK